MNPKPEGNAGRECSFPHGKRMPRVVRPPQKTRFRRHGMGAYSTRTAFISAHFESSPSLPAWALMADTA